MTTYTRYIVKANGGYLAFLGNAEYFYTLHIMDAEHFTYYEDAAAHCPRHGFVQELTISYTVEDA